MKTVLITGCSSGIGRDLVRAFLQLEWRVIGTMRRAPERQKLFEKESAEYGEKLLLRTLDVTSAANREAIVKELGSDPLDCLVNNAGFALFGALENTSEEQLRNQLEVNLTAPILLTKALLPHLRQAKGCVINISSMMGFVGFPLSSLYCSSKAGLSMFSESLHHELAPHGVRVAVIEPGGFRTNFSTNVQWGQGDDPAYRDATQGYRALQTKLSTGEGKPPTAVIAKILQLAGAQGPVPLRHRVGGDSVISGILQKLIPNGLRLSLLGAMFRKIFSGGAHG